MQDSKQIILCQGDAQTFLVGLGCAASLDLYDANWDLLDEFCIKNLGKHIFFTLSYELKNDLFALQSKNNKQKRLPLISCWTAKSVLKIEQRHVQVLEGEPLSEYAFLDEFLFSEETAQLPFISFQAHTERTHYEETVKRIKAHIQNGDFYELNYCQQFSASDVPSFSAASLWKKLLQLTKAPFAAYVNTPQTTLFCGSPERFLKKEGNRLLSQPIKGTAPRGKTQEEDEALKFNLANSPKDRAENTMITDLVRNDLSQLAQKNSVNVDEFCKVYSFGTVHQLISTISCELKEGLRFSEMLKATFPMGSMTGAPKKASMEFIEHYENFERGLFSGSIGCIFPNGDFDSNVVIRTLQYEKESNKLFAAVGGAITIQSDPAEEYEECFVKMNRLLQLFDGN